MCLYDTIAIGPVSNAANSCLPYLHYNVEKRLNWPCFCKWAPTKACSLRPACAPYRVKLQRELLIIEMRLRCSLCTSVIVSTHKLRPKAREKVPGNQIAPLHRCWRCCMLVFASLNANWGMFGPTRLHWLKIVRWAFSHCGAAFESLALDFCCLSLSSTLLLLVLRETYSPVIELRYLIQLTQSLVDHGWC